MDEILVQLKKAILAYDTEAARAFAKKTIEDGIDPLKAVNVAIEGIKDIGDRFGRGEAWLPDLVGGANAMMAAMPVIEEELKRVGKTREPLGTIVLGTVYGDMHSIGKDLVATLALAEGFRIVDLGVDVRSEVFMEAIREHKPEILGMSALLTTTAPEQGKIVRMLRDESLREEVKVVVGGGAITEDFAKLIGADGYEPTAPRAVRFFKRLVGKGE